MTLKAGSSRCSDRFSAAARMSWLTSARRSAFAPARPAFTNAMQIGIATARHASKLMTWLTCQEIDQSCVPRDVGRDQTLTRPSVRRSSPSLRLIWRHLTFKIAIADPARRSVCASSMDAFTLYAVRKTRIERLAASSCFSRCFNSATLCSKLPHGSTNSVNFSRSRVDGLRKPQPGSSSRRSAKSFNRGIAFQRGVRTASPVYASGSHQR